MNLNDINKIFTEGLEKHQLKLDDLGEKYFNNKVYPKILKAAKAGEMLIHFNCYSTLKDEALEKYLKKIRLGYDRGHSSDLFVVTTYRIWGWKAIKAEPNDILKKNV